MVETTFELMEYLTDRGAPYGISAGELYEAIPANARSPKVAYEFMQLKDISHIEPLSKGGEPAGDNWVLEDSSVNRSRGAETMTDEEVATAEADGKADADALRKAILVGGGLAGGQLLVDAALGTAAAVGAGTGAAVGCAVTGTVVTIATATALIGGGGYALYRGARWLSKR